MLGADDYFDISTFSHKKIFEDIEYVWEAVAKLETYIIYWSKSLVACILIIKTSSPSKIKPAGTLKYLVHRRNNKDSNRALTGRLYLIEPSAASHDHHTFQAYCIFLMQMGGWDCSPLNKS